VRCTGIGLHSGKKISLSLKPANPDEGITFIRADLPGRPRIKAVLENVVDTHQATTLGQGNCSVSTIEHLMAAITAMGLDNIDVEVDSPEVPIMDGSAAPFIFLLKTAGLQSQRKYRRFTIIKKPVSVADKDKRVTIYPSNCLKIDYEIDFDHPLLKKQAYSFVHSARGFEKEISRARTFGFLREVELLKKNGLALGGSLANAVVLSDFNILNPDGLRYGDEFVRHKILDFIGDISLFGAPVIGHFVAHKSGHTLNYALLNALRELPEHWAEVRFSNYAQYEKKRLQLDAFVAPLPAPV
jgi:UDP-3-O-[3-hydroxymyristoyl] N-acetylglucosamine deacetylase